MVLKGENAVLPAQAKIAADQGNLIAAIKITRQQTGLGLKEAKEAVESYSKGMQSRPIPDLDNSEIPLKALASLHRGKWLEAIKHTRDATGLGLKDSRLAVEAYLAANVGVDLKFQAVRAEQRRSLLRRAILVFLIGAAVVGYMLR